MKRILGIALALAVALSMLVATPAAAVMAPVSVDVDNPVAGELSDYEILFRNAEMLLGDDGDYIDIVFPAGTGLGTVTGVDVYQFISPAWVPVATTFTDVGTSMRIRLAAGAAIAGHVWVAIDIENVTNPTQGMKSLSVGTSNTSALPSEDFKIYLFKVPIVVQTVCALAPAANLISLPGYPADTDIEVVLATLLANPCLDFTVYWWDPVALEWLMYKSDSSIQTLTTMDACRAYWIKIKHCTVCCVTCPPAPSAFYVQGRWYPTPQGPPVKKPYVPSWNMVGFTSRVAMNASAYLHNAALPWPSTNMYAVTAIFSYDGGWVDEGWYPGTRDGLNPADWKGDYNYDVLLEPGKGYFMAFLADATIIPPIQ